MEWGLLYFWHFVTELFSGLSYKDTEWKPATSSVLPVVLFQGSSTVKFVADCRLSPIDSLGPLKPRLLVRYPVISLSNRLPPNKQTACKKGAKSIVNLSTRLTNVTLSSVKSGSLSQCRSQTLIHFLKQFRKLFQDAVSGDGGKTNSR